MKAFKILLAALLCLIYAAFSYASGPVDYADPIQVVRAFCQSEFEGVPDQDQRDLLVKFSKQRDDLHWKEHGLGASWVDTTVGELVLVSRYEIGKVAVNGNRGVANVVYQQVAETKGVGVYDRTFIKVTQPNQMEQLNLRFDGKRWWVYNPGLPRVSSEVMTKMSKELHQLYLDREKKSGLSPLRVKSFKKLKENIKVLENLDK